MVALCSAIYGYHRLRFLVIFCARMLLISIYAFERHERVFITHVR